MAGGTEDKKKATEGDKAAAGAVESSTTPTSTKDEATKTQPSLPPLDAAARRLERLLGGGSSTTTTTSATTKKATTSTPSEEKLLVTNPAKIVRRWLGSSSGASGKCTLRDIGDTASRVLDGNPNSPVLGGRTLLMETSSKYGGVDATIEDKMSTDDEEKKDDGTTKEVSFDTTLPPLRVSQREIEAWLLSLASRILWSQEKYTEAFALCQQGCINVQSFLDSVHHSIGSHDSDGSGSSETATASTVMNAPALFPLLARLYRLRSLIAESSSSSSSSGAAEDTEALLALRADLVRSHRMACLRRDVDCQATLLNLLLRDLLHNHQVEQAQKLLSNSTFPSEGAQQATGGAGGGGSSRRSGGGGGEGNVSNNQLCRYLYYSGQIQALRLEYTLSYSNLSQCLRKAPTNTGLGFRIAVQRLLVIVQLLMGEIPERISFFAEGMTKELEPYLHITQAVRRGDLRVFENTVRDNASRLHEDGTYTLISRLSHSVVKAGLRRLNVSYSRISLDDVATRLSLPSASSAEFVVAKAVRDGVIDATIDHAGAYVKSHDLVDVYATTEPMEAFHRRIAYCLTTHNDATRGMKYPPDAYKKQLEASRGQKSGGGGDDDDNKTDEERAAELEDELDDEF